MTKLAKLGARHNCSRFGTTRMTLPQCYVLSDCARLPDPGAVLDKLPRGACVIVRHADPNARAQLALRIIAPAHKLGLKVIIANDLRLALRSGADGVHLSERVARFGRQRIVFHKPGFICTAAAHSRLALWRAHRAGANAVLLSPVFPTLSHPNARTLGILRFGILAHLSPIPVIALGGISHANAARLRLGFMNRGRTLGFAAIGAWRD